MSVDDFKWTYLKRIFYAIKLKHLYLFADVQTKLGSWSTSEKLTLVFGNFNFFSVDCFIKVQQKSWGNQWFLKWLFKFLMLPVHRKRLTAIFVHPTSTAEDQSIAYPEPSVTGRWLPNGKIKCAYIWSNRPWAQRVQVSWKGNQSLIVSRYVV